GQQQEQERRRDGVLLLVVAFLRRVAYTRVAIFRRVTLRLEDGCTTPWKTLMRRRKFTDGP
ncbi:MAG: hypothetical protein RMJ98_11380, partial [Myxococcales bacterium]|nr:hypothetical protein [Polyangiaceae bacterium]MDW8249889.1 hypothetical protein [Myxococcales bacterium]